jgi:hypothetical protein
MGKRALWGTGGLLLLALTLPSLSQQTNAIRYVNHADPTCQGHNPCYPTITAALTSVPPGSTIRIQAGSYQEQLTLTGLNNTPTATEADRIVIEADPTAPLGSVVLRGTSTACTDGYAIRLQQSKFVTIRGLTITEAGGLAISLLGGNNANEAIHLERNRIVDNGRASCDGGIRVARGNPHTLIANNLIYNNSRDGLSFSDETGGPHYVIGNTIYLNQWNGVWAARDHDLYLINNLILHNGQAAGTTGGRFGVVRENWTAPNPAGIQLRHNLVCGNRLGEFNGPVLDSTDSGNRTPTGNEGVGVSASTGCDALATVFANVNGPDTLPGNPDDDFTLKTASPAIDRGVDPRTLGFPLLDALVIADYQGEGRRPFDGDHNGQPAFDSGALESHNNQVPVADAGDAQTVSVGATVQLDGSGSTDGDGDGLCFQWSFVPPLPAGSTATLPAGCTAQSLPTFVADRPGNYEVQLAVYDGVDWSAPDTVRISTLNSCPTTEAGLNQSIHVGATIHLDGSASSDSDGDLLCYAWTFTSTPAGSTATLPSGCTTEAFPTFLADQVGTYLIQLTVFDGVCTSEPATVAVTTENTPPVAKAGLDHDVDVGAVVQLDGSDSFDVDGDRLCHRWSFTAHPVGSTATLPETCEVRPTFLADQPGTYLVQLIVNDGHADSEPDTVIITSTSNNVRPMADAGPHQSGTVDATITLDGQGSSDADGDPLVYQWWFSSKPDASTAVLEASTTARPTFTIDAAGEYALKLVVNDGTVNSEIATVKVSTLNTPPVADAGVALSYPAGTTITLDGSGSTDVDGDLLTYEWALTTAPNGSTATVSDAHAVRPTFVLDFPGTYVAQLIVHDGTVPSIPDTVVISTLNSKPSAQAGPDQTRAVGATVTLDGTGSSDPDGTPLTFTWSLLTAPEGSAAVLQQGTTAHPSFVLDRAGVYTLGLVVSDGQFDSVPDFVTIATSNSRPVADAGPDQTPAPGALVQLAGGGSHDVDGDALSYVWSFVHVPPGSTVTLANSAAPTPTFLPDLTGGAYVLQLIVSDGQLNSAPDTVVVTAPNLRLIDNDGDGLNEEQGDCDDANPHIHPGVVEIPDNGIDEDCTGSDLRTLSVVFTPSATTVPRNGTLTLTITAPGLEGVVPPQIVSAFDLDVLYHPAVLQLTSVTFGSSLTPSLQRSSVITPGVADVAEVSLQPDALLQQVQPDTVVIATLTFTAIGQGTSTIALGADPHFGRDVKGLGAQVLPVALTGATATIIVTP